MTNQPTTRTIQLVAFGDTEQQITDDAQQKAYEFFGTLDGVTIDDNWTPARVEGLDPAKNRLAAQTTAKYAAFIYATRTPLAPTVAPADLNVGDWVTVTLRHVRVEAPLDREGAPPCLTVGHDAIPQAFPLTLTDDVSVVFDGTEEDLRARARALRGL